MKFTDVAGIMNIPYVAEKVKLSHVAEIVKLSHVAEILEAGSMYDPISVSTSFPQRHVLVITQISQHNSIFTCTTILKGL